MSLDKQEVTHGPNIWSSQKIWTIFDKITCNKQKYENSVSKGETARTDDSYIWETVTEEENFLLKLIHFAPTNKQHCRVELEG